MATVSDDMYYQIITITLTCKQHFSVVAGWKGANLNHFQNHW